MCLTPCLQLEAVTAVQQLATDFIATAWRLFRLFNHFKNTAVSVLTT